MEKKLDGNYTRMLQAILNKSCRQHLTNLQLYGHLPPITKTIKVRWTRHAGHCWKSRDGLISDVLLWTPSHDRAKAGRPACTYIQQLCEDTGCNPEDLPEAMNNREEWRERVGDIHDGGTTRWWLLCWGRGSELYNILQKGIEAAFKTEVIWKKIKWQYDIHIDQHFCIVSVLLEILWSLKKKQRRCRIYTWKQLLWEVLKSSHPN